MKKNILLIAISAGLLSVVACKKETTTTTEITTDTLSTETVTTRQKQMSKLP